MRTYVHVGLSVNMSPIDDVETLNTLQEIMCDSSTTIYVNNEEILESEHEEISNFLIENVESVFLPCSISPCARVLQRRWLFEGNHDVLGKFNGEIVVGSSLQRVIVHTLSVYL